MIPSVFGAAISFTTTPTFGYPWTTRDTGSAGYGYTSSAYGNGTYVILSSSYTLVSTDGINWTPYLIDPAGAYYAITFGQRDAGPGQFVAVGDKIITSQDGISWSEQVNPLTDPETGTLFAIAQNPVDREYVALTTSQVIYTTDGGTGAAATWNLGPVYPGQGFTSATYNSTGLLVVGNQSNGILFGDYNSFTQLGLYDPITFISNSLSYDGFIACSSNNKMFAISPSLTWAESNIPFSINWTSVAISDGGVAVAVNQSGDPYSSIVVSTDYGANWTARYAPANNFSFWRTVVWGENNFNPLFAAAADNGFELNNRLITAPG